MLSLRPTLYISYQPIPQSTASLKRRLYLFLLVLIFQSSTQCYTEIPLLPRVFPLVGILLQTKKISSPAKDFFFICCFACQISFCKIFVPCFPKPLTWLLDSKTLQKNVQTLVEYRVILTSMNSNVGSVAIAILQLFVYTLNHACYSWDIICLGKEDTIIRLILIQSKTTR